MNERPPLDATVDIPPADDKLDAGLAAAFGPDSGPPLPAGGSVLKALSAGLPSVPRILLREPESFGGSPIVRPSSEEMPDKQDPAARLQLHGEIARGGMGAVLKGRDVDLGRDVAVKVLLETHVGKTEMLQRFVEEAQISGQLQHPGIAPVYELGQFVDKRPYFTMKLVKGKTLAMLLTARKSPAEEQSRYIGIFAQICQTLAYAHARGVIHRDLKPSNVMVGAFGEVQVMDWGLAKVLKEGGIADELRSREHERAEVSVIRTQRSEGSTAPEAGSHTQAGMVLGTPAYMAPGQARGDVDLVDERADVFGLGAILCEILTGQPPYVGRGAEVQYKSRTAKLNDALARLDACGADAELLALARRSLAEELWERPRDAGAVAVEVAAYQNAVTERLRVAELGRAAEEARALEARATAAQERKARRMTLALAASLLLTLMLGGSGWLWLRGQREARLAENSRAVNAALTEAVTLREQARTGQGRAALALAARAREQAQPAEALVESGPADADLAAQVRQLLAELEADEKDAQLLAALDAARLAQAGNEAGASRFASERAVPLFREAFRVYGMAVGKEEAAAAAARLGQRPAAVREAVLAAVDEWIGLTEDAGLKIEEPQLEWLRSVQAAAEPEGWGKQLREAAAVKDAARRRAALEKLAESADVERLPALALTRLAKRLQGVRAEASAVALLRRAQPRHAGDFWINENLGMALDKQQPAEAVRYYTAAVALRPDSAGARNNLGFALANQGQRDAAIAEYNKAIELAPKDAAPHNNLGNALAKQGHRDAAIAEYNKAIELDPKYATAHNNLGKALAKQGHRDAAIAEYNKAIELDPKLAVSHNNLGKVLGDQGQWDEAIAEYKKAIELDPKYAQAHSNLGVALSAKSRVDEAIAEYKKAIELDPKLALAHCGLGLILSQQGRFAEAAAALKRGHELGSRQPGWRLPSAKWLRDAEQAAALAAKLPAFLRGDYRPRDNAERLGLVQVCLPTKHYAAAARLYADVFAADAKLAGDWKAGHRYNAACYAALAAAAADTDADKRDDKERSRLRQQARDWLRADLIVYGNLLDGGKADDQTLLQQKLQHWQGDSDLTSIRDAKELAKLPADERQSCEKLWADVAALLEKTQSKK